MSEVKIKIKSNRIGLSIAHTEVFINGKFAYQSVNYPNTEREKIQRLIDMIPIENTIVEVKE